MSKAIKHTDSWTPGMTEYTVIFDWSAESWSADDAIPVVVLATRAGLAQDRAQELLLATKPNWTKDDFNWVITFHGDVSSLVAE